MTQVLKLAHDLFCDVLRDKKTVTIRAGHRDVVLGPLSFEPPDSTDWSEMVYVKRVTYCAAKDITQEDAEADGADSPADMLMALQRFYPSLSEHDEVTIVEFQR